MTEAREHDLAAADEAFAQACAHLEKLDPSTRVKAAELYRRKLDGIEARTLADKVVGPPTVKGSARNAFRLVDDADISSAEKRRRVNRARAVAENPTIAERLATGALGTHQLDAVARASRRTDGDAARDESLLDEVAASSADQAGRIADAWVDAHLSDAEVQAEHDRQRRLRLARRGTDANGLATITLAGDRASIDIAWRRIEQRADAMYRAEGGRAVPGPHHERTCAQRFFDAAIELWEHHGGATSPRPTVVVTTRLDEGGELLAPTLAGSGRIPDAVLDRYRCDDQLVALVQDHSGQPLWLGRNVRSVSSAQRTALVARDAGCVMCGADHGRCEGHHLLPYRAPGRGTTDIDNLALLCGPCHRTVHDRRQTLIRCRDGTWSARAAEHHEIPPPAPSKRNKARAPGAWS